MSTKKIQIIGNLGAKVYTQNTEPTEAQDGALWIDLDEESFGSSSNAVLYTEQTLTEEQQAQARANIGAANVLEVEPADDDIPKVFIDGIIPTTKDDQLAELTYISKTKTFHAYLKIKCQGNTSMQFDKKNFTIKMYSDEARDIKMKEVFRDWKCESHKYVLKANYVDHTHARNIVSANLWYQTVASRPDYANLPMELKNSPRNGAIDGFPIKVYANGDYQGIYTWNIPKDDWTFGMDENDEKHIVLQAETNTSDMNPCNFNALWDGTDGTDWSVEVGVNSEAVKTSLNNLIDCVMNTDDTTFRDTIGEYLDVQSAIDYIIHCTAIYAVDNVAKNLLLATYDGVKWFCSAYDMDATFGSNYDGTLAVPANEYWPWNELTNVGLWTRIRKVFSAELLQRYNELKETVYSKWNMITTFEHFTDPIGNDLYAEDLEIYSNIPTLVGNVKYVRNFIRDRRWFADMHIEGLVYKFVRGSHTFSDNLGINVTVDENDLISITVPNPDWSTYPTINIGDVTQNTETCTDANGVWWHSELFELHAGDTIRFIIDAKSIPYMCMYLHTSVVDSYSKIALHEDGYGLEGLTYIDKEIVVDNNFSVGAISIQPLASVSFTFKLYVNGVRYI